MVARQAISFVPTLVLYMAFCTSGIVESHAADRPNRTTNSDMAVGRMMDSIFDFQQPTNKQRSVLRTRRRHTARTSSLEGRLVNNPNQEDGTPPYAMVDQYGGVLRYIEPVDHIDLDRYIGQIVGVRRDTGDTLLASQLAFSGFNSGVGSRSPGVQLVDFQETIPLGEIVEGSIAVPAGQEPIYLDDGLNFDGCPDCGSYVGCGSACRFARRQRLGGYFNYELTILRPVISEVETGPLESDYGFGHRFVLGYDGGAGMGVRARYWFYNHGHDYTAPDDGSIGIDMDVLDLEFTFDEKFRNWEMLASGGFRYGRAGLTDSDATTFNNNAEFAFEGFGPTVSLEATRGIGDRGIFLIGNARASLLFGEFDNFGGTAGVKVDDETMTVLESQLGIGYSRHLRRVTFTLRTVWETQFWLNDSWGDNANGFGSSLGFAGPTTSAELRF